MQKPEVAVVSPGVLRAVREQVQRQSVLAVPVLVEGRVAHNVRLINDETRGLEYALLSAAEVEKET